MEQRLSETPKHSCDGSKIRVLTLVPCVSEHDPVVRPRRIGRSCRGDRGGVNVLELAGGQVAEGGVAAAGL